MDNREVIVIIDDKEFDEEKFLEEHEPFLETLYNSMIKCGFLDKINKKESKGTKMSSY